MPPCPLHSSCHHQAAAVAAAAVLAAAVLAAAVAAPLMFAPAGVLAIAPAAAHQTALPAAYGAVLGGDVSLGEARGADAWHAAASLGPTCGSSLLLQGAA